MENVDVAIIGAGASGTLVAAQLGKIAPPNMRVAILGVGSRPARGIAYDTPYKSHLLNVPAGNMSAFPDEMDHFVRQLAEWLPNADGKTFAPRTLYGDYLATLLADALRSPNFIEPIPEMAVKLTRHENRWQVTLQEGTRLNASRVVLALGNLPPGNLPEIGDQVIPNYWQNPWAAGITQNLAPDAPILILGTGLTMVDVVLALRETGHRVPITALSRNGHLYHRHKAVTPRPLAALPTEFRSPGGAVRWIRKEAKIAEREGGDWRAVLDSLRPYTATIWQNWTPSQRSSFLRHARNLWDIHRHRIPAQVAAQLDELMAQGTLSIESGRLLALHADGQDIVVDWRPKNSPAPRQFRVARVVNCTGPQRNYSRVNSPLIASLREDGWLTPDVHNLGWRTTNEGQLVDRNGHPAPGLYTLGPPRIVDLWESVAMPEIRVQAAKLANLLVTTQDTGD